MPIFKAPYALTIVAGSIHVHTIGGTSVVGGLDECTGTAGVCSSVTAVDADITGTADTDVADDGSLTNAGIITWQPLGSLYLGGRLHNLAAGVFDAQVDSASILQSGDNAVLINEGVFRKSTGPGNLNCYVPLHNSGTVDTQIGTLTFADG